MPALKPKNQPEVLPRLLDERQAARYLNVSPSTMVRWRKRREGPSFFQHGGVIRYAPESLDKFIDKNMKEEQEHEQQG
jgi:hypothetical protein